MKKKSKRKIDRLTVIRIVALVMAGFMALSGIAVLFAML